MSASVRNLLIVLGILVAIVVYQLLFTDTYEGLFGIPAERITAEAPDIPTISARPSPAEPAPDPPEATEAAEAAAPEFPPVPAPGANSQFRSDQLLKNLPTENPFRSLERQRSALFDPFSHFPDSTLGDFELTNGGENSSPDPEAGVSTESAATITPADVSTSTPRTPRRLPSAPTARLPHPAVPPASPQFAPEFEALFEPLRATPLITGVRKAAPQQHEIRLSQVPSDMLPTLRAPSTPAQNTLAAVAPELVAYFAPLPEFAPLTLEAVGAELRARGGTTERGATNITNLRKYFSDIDITFTGTARGSVTVGVFRSNLTVGPVVLAVGQTLPETNITLTRLTTSEAEFTLGEQTRVLTLNLGW